jgi:hypothetical protein
MNDFELLKRLGRVDAPAGFEDRVLAGLRARRREAPARRKTAFFRWSMAGSTASLALLFVLLNFFVLRRPEPAGRAAADPVLQTVALDESVNYRHEMRAASYDPRTVYILEQVSEASNTLIKY